MISDDYLAQIGASAHGLTDAQTVIFVTYALIAGACVLVLTAAALVSAISGFCDLVRKKRS